MKLLITSDTHGNLELLKKLSLKYKDYVKIHLGDRGFDIKELDTLGFIYVDGNCDCNESVKDRTLNIEDNIIFMTHGDKYNVKFDLNKLYFKALESNAKYVFYGHTHFQSKVEFENMIFINPGALKDNKYCVIEDDNIKFF